MLSLTRKADYALVAMAALARSAPERMSARRLADIVHVPLPVLTNILHQLLHHGLIESTRGAQGGYRLAKGPDRITLFEMIEAVEGPVMLTRCCSDDEPVEDQSGKCDLEFDCRIKEPLRRVHESLRHFLAGVALSQIASEETPVRLGVVDEAHRDAETTGQSIETGRSALKADWSQS